MTGVERRFGVWLWVLSLFRARFNLLGGGSRTRSSTRGNRWPSPPRRPRPPPCQRPSMKRPQQVLKLAVSAAARVENLWPDRAPSFAAAIQAVHERLASLPSLTSADIAAGCFPNQPLTIVPLAIGLATLMRSAEEAILLAANVGGDQRLGRVNRRSNSRAMYPNTVNEDWYQTVEAVNQHQLVPMAVEFRALRGRPAMMSENR